MDLETAFKLIVSIGLSGLGWFAREIWMAMKELRADLHRIEVDLPKVYVAKDEFADAMKDLKHDLKEGFTRLYDKLDGKADK